MKCENCFLKKHEFVQVFKHVHSGQTWKYTSGTWNSWTSAIVTVDCQHSLITQNRLVEEAN